MTLARIFLVAALLSVSPAWSAEPAALVTCQLPKDGAWAKYRMTAGRPNDDKKHEMEVTIAAVGTVEKDGKSFRWIRASTGKPNAVFGEFLIPADSLDLPAPFSHFVEGTASRNDSPIKPADVDQAMESPACMILLGYLSDARLVDQQKVTVAGKEQACQHLEGNTSWVGRPARGNLLIEAEVWFSPTTHFGMVKNRLVATLDKGGQQRPFGVFQLELLAEGVDEKLIKK